MNKLKKIDEIIILSLIITIFFLRYIKPLYPQWYLIDFVILIYLFFRMVNNGIRINLGVCISFYFLLLIISINIIKFGFGSNVTENLLMTFMPLTIMFYIIYLRKNYDFITLNLVALKFTRFLNVYFFFNSIIIMIQFLTGSFMMEKFIALNPLVVDHMTGFIGLSGGNILNFLWIATIIFNFYFYLESKSSIRLALILIQIIIMTLLSVANENKMFVLTLVVNVVIFLSIQFIKSGVSSIIIRRIVGILFVSIIVFLFLYKLSDGVTSAVDNVINLVGNFFGSGYPDQNNERAYLNYLAFQVYNASGFGIGINSINLNNQSIHQHLGINSSSFILIQGGLVYFLAIVNFYSVIILDLMAVRKKTPKLMLYFGVFTTILVASYAGQPFRDHYLFAMLSLIYFAWSLSLEDFRNFKNEGS
ncbi:hypothetical protein [Bacillus rhizoplanae]|uniref:hypothetical protein n=1 Tax=Bacillus rhizoplanae TaxID=2880966 RepID=UPI003D25DF66